MTTPHLDPGRRHDVVLLFDVTDGNPNGDPDANNQPRTDEETGHGLVTDVALKRKIRDAVNELHDDPGFGIFVTAGRALNQWEHEAPQSDSPEEPLTALCRAYWDVRMFGAVLTRGKGKGSEGVRGPVSMTFARTLDPILPTDHAITRVTHARQEDVDTKAGSLIGQKWTVPYGLYRGTLFYSPNWAARVPGGVSSDDLAALWRAMTLMFDLDRSASRGVMALCGLYVFTHPDRYGVAPWKTLDRLVRVTGQPSLAARRHTDYDCEIDGANLPEGVDLTVLAHAWND